jgi:hypothetical protein
MENNEPSRTISNVKLLQDASVKRMSVVVVEDDLAIDRHDVPLDEAFKGVGINY